MRIWPLVRPLLLFPWWYDRNKMFTMFPGSITCWNDLCFVNYLGKNAHELYVPDDVVILAATLGNVGWLCLWSCYTGNEAFMSGGLPHHPVQISSPWAWSVIWGTKDEGCWRTVWPDSRTPTQRRLMPPSGRLWFLCYVRLSRLTSVASCESVNSFEPEVGPEELWWVGKPP